MKIVTRTALMGLFLVVASAMWSPAAAQMNSELLGGWVIADWNAPEGQAGPVPQRGLFMFTESGHYSMMFVIGDARAALPQDPSDAEFAAAYQPFVANSGRYSVSGDVITYEAFVAKDPAYMSRFASAGGEGNAQTMTFSVDEGRLTLRFGDGGPMQQATAILRRPGTGS